jgi:phage terminase small subunit
MTPKQERFVEEYLVDLNATQAAIRAGYSAKTAFTIGHENLRKPYIQEAIQKAKTKVSEKLEITVETVLLGLHKEATREEEGSSHGARVAAYNLLGKHLGMFTEKVEINLKTLSDEDLLAELATIATRSRSD